MNRLIRLPDGNWIDPTLVSSVKALEGGRCTVTGVVHPPRVVIMSQATWDNFVIPCESWEAAETIRDDVAKQCNEAER